MPTTRAQHRPDVAEPAAAHRQTIVSNNCNYRMYMASMVFECPALQDLRDKRPHLFDGAQTDAMVLFMWQDDMIGVVRFIDECLERILYTSDQP